MYILRDDVYLRPKCIGVAGEALNLMPYSGQKRFFGGRRTRHKLLFRNPLNKSVVPHTPYKDFSQIDECSEKHSLIFKHKCTIYLYFSDVKDMFIESILS